MSEMTDADLTRLGIRVVLSSGVSYVGRQIWQKRREYVKTGVTVAFLVTAPPVGEYLVPADFRPPGSFASTAAQGVPAHTLGHLSMGLSYGTATLTGATTSLGPIEGDTTIRGT